MIGQRLKELRERLGIYQVELGVVMGYSQTAISHIESGRRYPTYDSLMQVANEYGVTLDWLFGRSDEWLNGGTGNKEVNVTKRDDRDRTECNITPEQAHADYELVMSEPMLSLKVKGGNLSIKDMNDIANFIRHVRANEGPRDS